MKSFPLLIIILALVGGAAYVLKNEILKKNVMINSEMIDTGAILSTLASEETYFEEMKGFYVRPRDQGKYPGVVMIHEWWGMNDHIKDAARQLAEQGYHVLAADLFGKVATTSEEARKQVSALDQKKALANLQAAVKFLRERESTKIASLGWCFGGGQSLRLAVSGEKLDGTVIYYGSLSTSTAELQKIQWPVLGIFGDQDTSIPTTTVKAFESALRTIGVKNSIHLYPGVGHAFANPSNKNFSPKETKDAWDKTLIFLKESLQE